MNENIGKNLKTLGQVLFWIFLFANIITGIVLLAVSGDVPSAAVSTFVVLGLFFLIFGTLFSIIIGFLVYGFGHLITKVDGLENKNSFDDDGINDN